MGVEVDVPEAAALPRPLFAAAPPAAPLDPDDPDPAAPEEVFEPDLDADVAAVALLFLEGVRVAMMTRLPVMSHRHRPPHAKSFERRGPRTLVFPVGITPDRRFPSWRPFRLK